MNYYTDVMNNSCLYVDLSILKENVNSILSTLPDDCCIIPVLKDDAYGLGLIEVAECLAEFERIKCFAVAHVSEGLNLRAAGIEKDVLVMGSPLPFQIQSAVLTKLTLCAASVESAAMINEFASSLGMKAKVQIKLDIGLHRIGIDTGTELDQFIDACKGFDSLDFCGVFSHFSFAGYDELCTEQYRFFEKGIAKLKAAGINTYPSHISCSASSEYYPQYCLDAVRLGRRLYMDNPDNPKGNIKELASWRTYITALHPRKAGDSLGYGNGYFLENDALIATIGVGYGDGLDERLCTRQAKVLVNGELRPLLVCCMDQSLMDVSGLDCQVGDEVTIFGSDGKGCFVSAQELASYAGANEGCAFTSALSSRVGRVYIG